MVGYYRLLINRSEKVQNGPSRVATTSRLPNHARTASSHDEHFSWPAFARLIANLSQVIYESRGDQAPMFVIKQYSRQLGQAAWLSWTGRIKGSDNVTAEKMVTCSADGFYG